MSSTAPAAPATKTATKTTYHVLKLTRAKTTVSDPGSGHDEYALVAQDVPANSTAHAIRVHAEKVAADGAGVYVAIPSRSFKPTVVKVATTTTVKVGT